MNAPRPLPHGLAHSHGRRLGRLRGDHGLGEPRRLIEVYRRASRASRPRGRRSRGRDVATSETTRPRIVGWSALRSVPRRAGSASWRTPRAAMNAVPRRPKIAAAPAMSRRKPRGRLLADDPLGAGGRDAEVVGAADRLDEDARDGVRHGQWPGGGASPSRSLRRRLRPATRRDGAGPGSARGRARGRRRTRRGSAASRSLLRPRTDRSCASL